MTNIAVVGAGIIGLATAHALRAQGATVTVYDPADPGSGQSAGHSRIFRHAHDDARMVALAARSRRLWRTWEEEFDVELISPGGALNLGAAAKQKLATLELEQVPARLIDTGELAGALPLLAPFGGRAMLDESGGAIHTRATFAALVGRLHGALAREEVLGMRRISTDRVEIRTQTGLHTHDRAVVCAGTGTGALASGLGVTIPMRVATLVRVTFAVRGEPQAALPTLQDSSGAFGETGVYATPYPGNARYSVGLSDDVDITAPGGAEQLAALTERTRRYAEKALPGLDPTPVGYVHCRITELPWHPDGCAVWDAGPVTMIAGHNLFKQAPALGQDLAQIALGAPMPQHLRPEAQLGAPREAAGK